MDSSQSVTLSGQTGARPRTPPPVACIEDDAADVLRYATMPIELIDEELMQNDIDPKPTIKGILAVVTAAQEVGRRQLHRSLVAVSSRFREWGGAMRAALTLATRLVLKAVDEVRQTMDGVVRPWDIGRAMPVRVLN